MGEWLDDDGYTLARFYNALLTGFELVAWVVRQ